jgi:tetratricopeptide (TPR) repeat protein
MPRVALTSVAALILATLPAQADRYADCNQSEDRDRQIAACTEIVGLEGESSESRAVAFYNRGNAYGARSDVERAIADYDQAISLDPSKATVFYDRGNAYVRKGDFDRAIADYDRAVALDPNYADAYFNRGNAYNEKGDTERAIADLRKVLSIDPSDDEAQEFLWMLGGAP